LAAANTYKADRAKFTQQAAQVAQLQSELDAARGRVAQLEGHSTVPGVADSAHGAASSAELSQRLQAAVAERDELLAKHDRMLAEWRLHTDQLKDQLAREKQQHHDGMIILPFGRGCDRLRSIVVRYNSVSRTTVPRFTELTRLKAEHDAARSVQREELQQQRARAREALREKEHEVTTLQAKLRVRGWFALRLVPCARSC